MIQMTQEEMQRASDKLRANIGDNVRFITDTLAKAFVKTSVSAKILKSKEKSYQKILEKIGIERTLEILLRKTKFYEKKASEVSSLESQIAKQEEEVSKDESEREELEKLQAAYSKLNYRIITSTIRTARVEIFKENVTKLAAKALKVRASLITKIKEKLQKNAVNFEKTKVADDAIDAIISNGDSSDIDHEEIIKTPNYGKGFTSEELNNRRRENPKNQVGSDDIASEEIVANKEQTYFDPIDNVLNNIQNSNDLDEQTVASTQQEEPAQEIKSTNIDDYFDSKQNADLSPMSNKNDNSDINQLKEELNMAEAELKEVKEATEKLEKREAEALEEERRLEEAMQLEFERLKLETVKENLNQTQEAKRQAEEVYKQKEAPIVEKEKKSKQKKALLEQAKKFREEGKFEEAMNIMAMIDKNKTQSATKVTVRKSISSESNQYASNAQEIISRRR